VICPVTPGCAPFHGGWPGAELGHDSYQAFNHLHVFALGGAPAAVVPIGSENGIPIGVQIVGQPWREDVALAAARALDASALGR
jgi:Asp-tRNA(Asn)/Glu-tRNA(Gln) amidotransferase A subunit family amidase